MAKNKNRKTILLTGGHAATTAIATTEEIIRRAGSVWEIYWVGTKRALEGKDIETLESKALPEMGVAFHPIVAGRLQRKFSIWTVPSIAKIPVGFIQAFFALRKIKPDVILSFGGFVAFPVVFWGWVLGVPVVVHEQTSTAGRANRLSAFFAKKIAVSRQASVKYFPREKVVVVGNPIMTQIAEISPKAKMGTPPTLFVTGGSRGSRTINDLIEKIIKVLLEDYYLIHQVGDLDFEKFKKIKVALPKGLSNNYEIYPVIDPMQIDGVYRRADVVVARAGANTVSELIAAKIPSLLIPIPWAYENEQGKNASYAKEFGIATVVDEDLADHKVILEKIKEIFGNWKKIKKAVKEKKSPDVSSSGKLVDILEEYI